MTLYMADLSLLCSVSPHIIQFDCSCVPSVHYAQNACVVWALHQGAAVYYFEDLRSEAQLGGNSKL